MQTSHRVEVIDRAGLRVLVLSGSAGLEAQADLDRAANAILAGRPEAVVIDARGLEFLASLAIGSLLRLSKSVRRHGGRVRVGGLRPEVREVFRRTRVDEVLDVEDDHGAFMTMLQDLSIESAPTDGPPPR